MSFAVSLCLCLGWEWWCPFVSLGMTSFIFQIVERRGFLKVRFVDSNVLPAVCVSPVCLSAALGMTPCSFLDRKKSSVVF